MRGTVVRAANLLVITLASIVVAWLERAGAPGFLLIGGASAFAFGCALRFRGSWAPWGAPLFAVLLGLALGGAAGLMWPLLLQVVLAPVGVLASLLVVYQAGWLRPTRNRDLAIASAAGGLAFLYLFQAAARAPWAWGPLPVPFVHRTGPGAVLWTLLALVASARGLVEDFDRVEEGSRRGAPKQAEWYAAFGLLVGVVWFYVDAFSALAGRPEHRS